MMACKACGRQQFLHTHKACDCSPNLVFTKDLPKTPLDGEFWLGHGKFDALSGAVWKDVPIDDELRSISYMVFELPNASGKFAERAKRIAEIVKQTNIRQLKPVTLSNR